MTSVIGMVVVFVALVIAGNVIGNVVRCVAERVLGE